MSDVYVRTLCEQWAGAITSVPYFNTINEETNPQDTTWFTLDYQAINRARDTFCSMVEQGLVSLVFFGAAGGGYEELCTLAQDIADEFVSNVDPAGRLTLEFRQSPSDYTSLGAPRYIIEVAVNYTFR